MFPNIPVLQKINMQGLVDLYPARPDLYPFENLGPSIKKDGLEWNTDIESSGMAAAKVSPFDMAPQQVQPRPVGKLQVMPERVAEYHAWKDTELKVLRAPGTDSLIEQRQVVAKATEGLLMRWRTLKSLRWAQILQNRQVVVTAENGLTYTIDYTNLIGSIGNPTTLGEAGLAWSNVGASIVRDIAAAKRAFRALYGVAPNVVYHSPDIEEYLLKNTEFTGWVKATFGREPQEFLSMGSATPAMGGWRFMNLEWRSIGSKYQATDNDPTSLTDYWGQNVLTFAYIAGGERLFEFWQAKTDETDNTGGPIVEPWKDPMTKARYGEVLYANGIPVINVPNRIARIANIAA